MTTGRRDVLKMMAGAALYAAASPLKSLGSPRPAPPAPLPTYVILNGIFGLRFRDSDLLCFLPEVTGHNYRIDEYDDLCSPGPHPMSLTGPASTYHPLFYYVAAGNVYVPGSDGFQFDPSAPNRLELSLPYPIQIYAHRLLDIDVSTAPGRTSKKKRVAGALVLEYAAGPPPNIPQISHYVPDGRTGYYQVLVAAYNPDTTMNPLNHARQSWSSMAAHFHGMNWTLSKTDYSTPRAGAGPGTIDDAYVERESIANDPCLKNVASTLSPSTKVLGAMNCKSPAFVVTS